MTDKKARRRRWVQVGVGATLLTAALTALLVWRSDKPEADSVNAITSGGDVSCVAQGSDNSVNCPPPKTPTEIGLEKAIESAAQSTEDPTGAAPWQFTVVRTFGEGLKVRTSPERDGRQIGGIRDLHPAWVICQHWSGFDPQVSSNKQGLWYLIAWSQTEENSHFHESQPSDQHTGWVFSDFLLPEGHNGNVPDCDQSGE